MLLALARLLNGAAPDSFRAARNYTETEPVATENSKTEENITPFTAFGVLKHTGRANRADLAPGVFYESPLLVLPNRSLQLFLRVHHDWAVPRDRFFDGSPRCKQEADGLLFGGNNDCIAGVATKNSESSNKSRVFVAFRTHSFPVAWRKFPDPPIKFPDNVSKFPDPLSREFGQKLHRRRGFFGR